MSGCYDRRNNENIDHFPCDPDGDLKSCCERGDSCAGNGLCVTSDGDALTPYFIHGCTIDDWDDPTCPTQCYNSTGNGIQPCGDGMFCCWGRGGCDCNDEDEVFSMDPVRIVASIPTGASRSTDATAVSSLDASISSAIASATAETTTEAAPTSTNDESSISGENNDNSLPIGLGVGLGVGIPLIAIGAGLIWFLMKKRAKTVETHGSKDMFKQDPALLGNYVPVHAPPAHTAELDGRNSRVELP
ncbi:hypothetical protein ACJ41O_000703 [Fusarium nematophilum]